MIINLKQGSQAWLEHRSRHYNASDAAAMLGISPNKTRDQLIAEMATGDRPSVPEYLQKIFDRGHATEAKARPLINHKYSIELYPVVLSDKVNGLPLSASLDGLTIDNTISWEHKLANNSLITSLYDGVIPVQYHPQMEQGLMLSGAERCLFTASKEDWIESLWYVSDATVRTSIIEGWATLKNDVENYTGEVFRAKKTLSDLLPVDIKLVGKVTASNLESVKRNAFGRFKAINKDLQTDDDFVDAKASVKWIKAVEAQMVAAKTAIMSQSESIQSVLRTVGEIQDEARLVRLALSKLIKSREADIKASLISDASEALAKHTIGLYSVPEHVPIIKSSFGDCIKGMSNLDNIKVALNTRLAEHKIDASKQCDSISINVGLIDAHSQYNYLFADRQTLIFMASDDLKIIVEDRVSAEKRRKANEQIKTEKKKATEKVTEKEIEKKKPLLDGFEEFLQGEVKTTPTSDDVIKLVAHTYDVNYETAITWLDMMEFGA